MTDRDAAIRDFYTAAGWGAAGVAPLAGDASNRRYLRLGAPGGATAVLMDAPPDRGEDVRPFLAVTDWLRGLGLSAPRIMAADPDQGLLLIEDLGDALFARVAGADEASLYAAAVDLLVDLVQAGPPARLGGGTAAAYDGAVLAREAALAVEWYRPGVLGTPTPADLAADYAAVLGQATAGIAPARDVLVLRDYHAENLIWLPDRVGAARVGLLDYQDALVGHAAYDLVSLLEDARRDVAPALAEAMLARHLARSGADPVAFRAGYAALGAQRNLKIIGIFARLARRDGKPRYLDLIPRVWRHLMHDLAHPDLAALRAWVRAHLPPPEPAALAALART